MESTRGLGGKVSLESTSMHAEARPAKRRFCPLSGSVRILSTHKLISDLVDGSHTFSTDCFCVSGEFLDIFKMGGGEVEIHKSFAQVDV